MTTQGRSLKWATIQKRFPDSWVAIKPVGDKLGDQYSNDGVVLYHHAKRKLFYKYVIEKFKKEPFLAFTYTGNPIKTGNGERVLMSTW